jgi:hypothetical protein
VLQALGRMGDREALTRFWVDMRLHNVEPDAVVRTSYMPTYTVHPCLARAGPSVSGRTGRGYACLHGRLVGDGT